MVGEKLTRVEISFSPSHFSLSGETPDQVINGWIEFQGQCMSKLKNEFECQSNCVYGPSAGAKFDLWHPKRTRELQHVHIFIHGGFWQECDKTTYGSLLRCLLESGISVVMLGYDHATEIPISDLIIEVESGVKCIMTRYPNAQLSISGHSAGAHLAAKMLETRELADRLESAVLFCGVYDLLPLVETYIGRNIKRVYDIRLDNEWAFSLTLEEAKAASIDAVKLSTCKTRLFLVGAEHDAPAFNTQGRELTSRLRAQEVDIELKVKSYNEDHFSLISALGDLNSPIAEDFVQFVNSRRSN